MDLTKRLRAVVPYQGKSSVAFLCHEAADEYDALSAEIAALKEQLAAAEQARDANHNLAVANGARAKEEEARSHLAEANLELREASVAGLRQLIGEMVDGLKPFADAAREFSIAIGPDGIDDGLTVEARICARPEREAVLCTANFSNAAALISRARGAAS